MHPLRTTSNLKHVLVPRLIAGLPLLVIGVMHLTGAAPMRPILEAARIPLVDFNAVAAPAGEVLAALLLLSGGMARIGGLIALGAMSVAIYAHIVADWGDEPPIALPIVVLACSAYVLWRGAGAWSLDLAATRSREP